MNAYYNHGRWLADCPSPDCHAAIRIVEHPLVSSVDVECDCRDEAVCDHQTIPCGVGFPVELPGDRVEIERLTGLRPRRVNRNWLPGESPDDLKAENLLHGVKV